MSFAYLNGVNLYYEIRGEGFPLIWSHEFAGDHRSWVGQVDYFATRYQVVTYNARGYVPSEVPEDLDAYGQDQAVGDLKGLLDHLSIERAHIGGLSMGGNVALNFGLMYPERAESLVVVGTGSGSIDSNRFRCVVYDRAALMESDGMRTMEDYLCGPTRVQLLRKDPRAWRLFVDQFHEHSPLGSAMTLRGVQGRRSSIFDLEDRMRGLKTPTLIMLGDEDEPCIETSIFMKRCISRSGLVMFAQSGHAINLEEPELFNRTVDGFLTDVEAGKWTTREECSETGALV